MKSILTLGLTLLISVFTFGQLEFEENFVAFGNGMMGSIFAPDIDNDGDKDILTGKSTSGIIWFENIDGQGLFGPKLTISSTLNGPYSLFPADIDNDGDIDIFSSSVINSTRFHVWFENTDGLGDFSTVHPVDSFLAGEEGFYYVVDIDNDLDMDLVTIQDGYLDDSEVAYWYENLDNGQNFEKHEIIMDDNGIMESIHFADMDGDGYQDLVTASTNFTGQIAWYKNQNGQGDFGAVNIIDGSNNFYNVYPSDLDGDGDMDVTYVSNYEVYISKNLDGLGNFDSGVIVNSDISSGRSSHAADIDWDTDMDIFSTSFWDDDLAWYENTDGAGTFGNKQIISTDINQGGKIITADIDNDGKLDVVSNSWSKISWFKNLGLTSNEIKGNLLLDFGLNDCSQDTRPVAGTMVNTGHDSLNLSTVSLSNGFYQFFIGEGDYNTQVNLPTSGLDFYSFQPMSDSSIFIGTGTKDTINFCLTPFQNVDDLNITVLPISDARPGFNATYQLILHNAGTTKLTGSAALNYDNSKLDFISANEPLANQTDNILTFDFEDLYPFESIVIELEFYVLPPPEVNLDDILIFSANIEPVSDDYTPLDNQFRLEQIVIGAFDPNDIRVLEGEEILITEVENYLHYIIRFQNTGTAEAINVRVENRLDDKLDWATFTLENTSHSNRIEIAEGNQVSFIFEDIYLPDSTSNEPESHGFIAYKIKPKNTVMLGDSIFNNADIYFDFNEPIFTNTVFTTIVEPLSILTLQNTSFKVFPVPTNGILKIESTNPILQVKIYNQLGQLNKLFLRQSEIDISMFPRGIYFCIIEDETGKIGIEKVVKE
jgi:hypothetical protein